MIVAKKKKGKRVLDSSPSFISSLLFAAVKILLWTSFKDF